MTSRLFHRVVVLAAAAIVALAGYGCGKKAGVHTFIPDKRPTVTITSAPVDTRDTAFYAYRINWAGNDDDGRVDHFTYAIDPKDGDTTWTTTSKKEDIFFFRSQYPVLGGDPTKVVVAVNGHTFVIKAWDDQGLASVPVFRTFFSYTVAPTVFITDPAPLSGILQQLTPATRISWVGSDPDGQFTQKPVKYKYKLLAKDDPEFDFTTARRFPDQVRAFYAATNFAGWDSVSGDTTTVQYTGLLPGQSYIFMVIGYDEAGAYSPNFSLNSNMLQFQVGFAGSLGPRITVFNEAFFYSQVYSSWFPNEPSTWINLEIPATTKVTFNWFATPPPGGLISYYRWRVGGDVSDETPRTNEATDLAHWSAKSSGTTSCTLPGFVAGDQEFLYIGAWDNNGLRSLVTVRLIPIQPTFENPLLIVDDSRAEVDQFNATTGRIMPYTQVWPAASEVDTFFYAVGGVPWRNTQVLPTAPIQPVSPPGLFAGYQFDTLGTRQGLQIASTGVPLSKLGKYQHVLWMTDRNSLIYAQSPIDLRQPESTIRWMCTPNHSNTLGSYIAAGGQVWFAGGNSGVASMVEFNAKGVNDNDTKYGSSVSRYVFSFDKNELIPGRLMYDGAAWQNEFVYQQANISSNLVLKAARIPRPWTSPGYGYVGTVTSPDYTKLPAQMRIKALTRGDSLPPTRTVSSQFYGIPTFDVEYLTAENRIYEDLDPSLDGVNEQSVLDSLMDARGPNLAFQYTPVNPNVPETPCMTYYHGPLHASFVFTGFSLCIWSKPDCIAIIDFVLQDIWHLTRQPVARVPQEGTFARRLVPVPATSSAPAVPSRIPTARSVKR